MYGFWLDVAASIGIGLDNLASFVDSRTTEYARKDIEAAQKKPGHGGIKLDDNSNTIMHVSTPDSVGDVAATGDTLASHSNTFKQTFSGSKKEKTILETSIKASTQTQNDSATESSPTKSSAVEGCAGHKSTLMAVDASSNSSSSLDSPASEPRSADIPIRSLSQSFNALLQTKNILPVEGSPAITEAAEAALNNTSTNFFLPLASEPPAGGDNIQ